MLVNVVERLLPASLTAPMITTLMSAAKSHTRWQWRRIHQQGNANEGLHHFSPQKGALVVASTIEGGVNRPGIVAVNFGVRVRPVLTTGFLLDLRVSGS